MSDLTNAEKREIQLQREAYLQGRVDASNDFLKTEQNASARAAERFPDPTPEPTIVTAVNSYHWRIAGGIVQWREGADRPWFKDAVLTPTDLMALGEIAQEYYENQRKDA